MIANMKIFISDANVRICKIDGVIWRLTNLPDRSQYTEQYDPQTGIYKAILYGANGNILRTECYDQQGNYEIKQLENNEMMTKESGITLFTKRLPDVLV